MTSDSKNARPQNLFLIALFIIVTLFTAYYEGYLPLISIPFWISLIAGFSITIWLACGISTIRLLSLMLGIFDRNLSGSGLES